VKLNPNYVVSPPGESVQADVYNILAAGLAGNFTMAGSIVKHQPDDLSATNMLGCLLALVVGLSDGEEAQKYLDAFHSILLDDESPLAGVDNSSLMSQP